MEPNRLSQYLWYKLTFWQAVNADAIEGDIRAQDGSVDGVIEEILSRIDEFDTRNEEYKNNKARKANAKLRAKDDSLFFEDENDDVPSDTEPEKRRKAKPRGTKKKETGKQRKQDKDFYDEPREVHLSRGKKRGSNVSDPQIMVSMDDDFVEDGYGTVDHSHISCTEEDQKLEEFRFYKKPKH